MSHHHRIAQTVALTLALAAATAPAASAYLEPPAPANSAIENASTPAAGGGPCSEVCSGGAASYGSLSGAANEWPDTAPLPQPRAAILVSGHNRSMNATVQTLASPMACGDVCSPGYPGGATPATVLRVAAPSDRFDWADAGIGAGAAVVLILIGTGGLLTTTNRRARRAQRPQHVTASS